MAATRIAKRKSSKSGSAKAKLPHGVKDLGYGFEVSRRSTWSVMKSGLPKSADDLSFVSRDSEGTINWWDVTPSKTRYYHAHLELGRAYAFELLDLINSPGSKEPPHVAANVCRAVGKWSVNADRSAAGGMADGFFAVIGEFLETGTADR